MRAHVQLQPEGGVARPEADAALVLFREMHQAGVAPLGLGVLEDLLAKVALEVGLGRQFLVDDPDVVLEAVLLGAPLPAKVAHQPSGVGALFIAIIWLTHQSQGEIGPDHKGMGQMSDLHLTICLRGVKCNKEG